VKIELNHTIVPARDKEQSARFYERIFGFKYEGPMGHFAPVRIPSQSLTPRFRQPQVVPAAPLCLQSRGGRIR